MLLDIMYLLSYRLLYYFIESVNLLAEYNENI